MTDLLVGFIAWSSSLADEFEDWVEPRFPWLTFNHSGDPVSWFVSHPFWTACGGAMGALVGLPFHDPRLGFVIGCAAMCVFYVVRETLAAREAYRAEGMEGAWRRLKRNPYPRPQAIQVGWLADAIGDVAGPVLFTFAAWWVLL